MTHKRKKPTREAYYGEAAEEYSQQQWMARNQHRTTRRALELLKDPKLDFPRVPIDESLLFLDVACGSGYSSDVLDEAGLPFVGIDLSWDMLRHAAGKGYPVVQGEMRHLPIRPAVGGHGICISALNFIADEGAPVQESAASYSAAAEEFARVLGDGGRFAIEFYPASSGELEVALAAFKRAGFKGFLVIDNPNTRKEQKFLAIEKVRV